MLVHIFAGLIKMDQAEWELKQDDMIYLMMQYAPRNV